MRGNSGIIGLRQNTSTGTASGVHDTFDNYIAEIGSDWPQVRKFVSISPNTGNVPEGTTTTFTVTTSGSSNTETLYYSITTAGGVNSSDFSGGLTGSFTITDNSGTIDLVPTGGDGTESETFTIEIRRDSSSGLKLGESGTYTMTDGANTPSPGTYAIFSGTGTNSTSAANIMNAYYRRYLIGFTYTAAELQASSSNFQNGATISGLSFYITNPVSTSYSPYPNYAVALCHVPNGANNTNPSLSNNRTNFTTVKAQHNIVFTSSGTKTITFDNNFSYNGTDGLGLIFAWGQIPTGYSTDGQSYIESTGNAFYSRTDSTGTYNVSSSASSALSYRPRVDLIVS